MVTISPFDGDEEAIRSANDTPYGLNVMVFARHLRAPFGDVGDSGIGREGGTFSREFFPEPETVVMRV